MFGGGGGGGQPDFASMMNSPMFQNMAQQMMNNPAMMNMWDLYWLDDWLCRANQMMQNPETLNSLMSAFGGNQNQDQNQQ